MRSFGLRVLLFFFVAVFAQSCLVQKAPERSLTSSNSILNPPGVTPPTTDGSTSKVLGLWSRSPVQSAGSMVTASDNLEILNRQNVTLFDLDSSGYLNGSTVKVFYSTNDKSSPRASAYGSSKIPWSNKDFQAYMVYGHASSAYRYIQSLFPNISFQVNGVNLFPITAYSLIKGSPFDTVYAPSKTGTEVGTLMFYGEDDAGYPYNVSDEADAIYHEVGHSFQHVLNPDVMGTPGNYDMDMLLEALADFFAASAFRDDKVLLYLESNSPSYGEDRTGSNQIRRLDGDISFPNAYIGEFHLDGRIVASALNDVRKYLSNLAVVLKQPLSTTVRWSAPKAMTTAQAYDKVLLASHEALRKMIPTSTILFFSQKFFDELMNSDWSAYCLTDTSCVERLRNGVQSILLSRGIYKTNNLRVGAFSVGLMGSGKEVIFRDNLNFFPLAPVEGYSNTNAWIDKCEALLLTPNFYLNSGVAQSVYDVIFRLNSSSGLTAYRNIDILTSTTSSSYQKTRKIFGFLLPGEGTFQAIASNRFYQDHQGSHLASSSINSTIPSALGWATRAPSVPQSYGTIGYDISFRPFDVLNAPGAVYSNYKVTQSIQVYSGAIDFCSKN